MREGKFARTSITVWASSSFRYRPYGSGEDVLVLAKSLLDRYSGETGKKIAGFERTAIERSRVTDGPATSASSRTHQTRVIMAESKRMTPADLELDSLREYHGKDSARPARPWSARSSSGRSHATRVT